MGIAYTVNENSFTELDSKTAYALGYLFVEPHPGTKRKTRYIVRIGNTKLYDAAIRAGLTPRKSLTMKFPYIGTSLLPHFIRGFFDGDGCAHIERDSRTQKPKRLTVAFASGSKPFLEKLSAILQQETATSIRAVYRNKNTYQLRYSSKDSAKIFKFMYKGNCAYLKRKYDKFVTYFEESGHVVK